MDLLAQHYFQNDLWSSATSNLEFQTSQERTGPIAQLVACPIADPRVVKPQTKKTQKKHKRLNNVEIGIQPT